MRKAACLVFSLVVWGWYIPHASAITDEDKARRLSQHMQELHVDWSVEQALKLIRRGKSTAEFLIAVSTAQGVVSVKIIGDTILVNGKDITGNLGEATYGDNSPIIKNVSQGGSVNYTSEKQAPTPTPWVWIGMPGAILATITLWRLWTQRYRRRIRAVIQGMVKKLLTDYEPQQVILFGSQSRGMPQPDSDIDLLVIKETPERFIDRWVTVRRILSDPQRTVPVETLVLTPGEVSTRLARGDQFIAGIMKDGEVLYAA